MLANAAVFTVVYLIYTFLLGPVITYFRSSTREEDRPKYTQRVKRVEKLLKKLGYKLGFRVGGRSAFGFVTPLPDRVFLSQKLLLKLDFSELQYILYHEIGHLKLRHPLKLTIFFLFALVAYLIGAYVFGLDTLLAAVLFALVLGNVGLHIGRIYEDEADLYALRELGFEKVQRGILALQHLSGSTYDYGPWQGYFDVHRTHLARLDRLKAKLESK